MQVCRSCLYTEHHPLRLTFDEKEICSGCRVHEEKNLLDWKEREQKLRKILEEYRCRSGNNYDCIIPVSGARDSYFIVNTIKQKFGMNPLLVTYNKHYNTAVGFRNLANLRILFNCDILTQTINPDIVKKITRSTFRRFGSIYWHCLAGQTVYPVQVAVKFKIPLIIWGAHQGVDQVGMYSHLNEVEMTRKYRKEHDLMGYEAEDLINEYDGIQEADIASLVYPDNRELEQVGIRGIYLNNYVRWDSRTQHEKMIRKYGYESAQQNRTFDSYNDVDCWIYSDVHDYLKYIKHGFGKVVDHACREIRLRHMNRDEGIELATAYQSKPTKYLNLFLDWLGITENSFNYIADQHRNPIFWERTEKWKWKLKINWAAELKSFPVTHGSWTNKKVFSQFVKTPRKKSTDMINRFILIGKGKSMRV